MYTSAACIFNNVSDTLNITSHHVFKKKKKNPIAYSLPPQSEKCFYPELNHLFYVQFLLLGILFK